MKFSILLPTRNRLDLLKFAVQSVLDQEYRDWEIVISDNASEDDVAGYVASLADARIKYLRSDALLPVTQNWNRALEASTGEYFIMLGDDDCLLGGCLSVVAGLLREFDNPDLIYAEAIQYAYPGVIPGLTEGFTQFGYCAFLNGEREPFYLRKAAASSAVRNALGFRIAYSYNMQHSVVGRGIATKLAAKGAFFQSPYPDYYATNALLLAASRILVCPWPLVGIGISPKSFGFYYFNKRENEGVEFLQNIADPDIVGRVKETVLPGSNMNTSWLLAMESLKKNFPHELPADVDYRRYRFMQLRELLRAPGAHKVIGLELARHGGSGERIFWRLVLGLDRIGRALLPEAFWQRCLQALLWRMHVSHPRFDARKTTVPYKDLLELSRAMRADRDIPADWHERLEGMARR